ncbi:MAG TPA: alpha-galactosidase [Candidatus Limiplasma sp.]|nr:alpha-galactosidase [Candidatus Limiplasma sp.]HRX08015.1 alpha-galactosidase [Candidatus Limiplasma sp.]
MITLLSAFSFGDLSVEYRLDPATGRVGLELVPAYMNAKRQERKQALDPLVQLMIRGDAFPGGFANGHTLRGSVSLDRFAYVSQQRLDGDGEARIITTLRAKDGQELRHQLIHREGASGVEISTLYHNGSGQDITLDMLSSFCLGGITPFIAGDAANSLVAHRLRSKWSNEARLESISVEDLQLEPSWSGHGVANERFGQLGSMPVRKYFPFAAVEDTQNHVIWGVQLACPSSWQIELYRKDDGLCISGGLADFDFGHWSKTLQPGESLQTPPAFVSVCVGDIDLLCSRLVSMQERALKGMALPTQLPVVFNEFCTTWGTPSLANVKRCLDSLQGHDIDYFVIDAGWHASEDMGWEANMGDWEVNETLFPGGFAPAIDAIRAAGMKPGLWFEAEVCGRDAKAYAFSDHLLQRHGQPITVGTRRFWDMRDDWVTAYLEERIIGLLKRWQFDYVKIDYNESVGIGCDGAESLGEGLRQNQLAAHAFMDRLRRSIPGLVVENCSSGGHRLEPLYLGISQLSSFSDAHEEREIPIIAANLHRAMLPSQSLIWAVLRKHDTPKRLIWSLSATFLGVMCLSGDIYDMTPNQWAIVDEAIRFYRRVSPLIQHGTSRRLGPPVASYRHPDGWQAVERTGAVGDKLIVVHVFDQAEAKIQIPLRGSYRLEAQFCDPACKAALQQNILDITLADGACAFYLRRI